MTALARRRLVAVAAGVALGVAAVAATGSAQTNRTGARTLRVLTFNIHHAEGVDGNIDVGRVAQVIRDTKAEIVSLQEVDRGVERTGRRDLLKEIADLAGMRFAFGKNLDHQGGDYGNALLTTLPIVSEGNRPLPNSTGGEPRGALQVVLDAGGTQVLVLATHLDHRKADGDRVASAGTLLEAIASWGSGPVIAMGDFNDVPGSPTWTRLSGLLTDVWAAVGAGEGHTSPAEAPRRRIDWILVRGLDPVSAEVPRSEASDHLPVAATVTLR